MKTISSELAYFFRGRAKRNIKLLLFYVAFLVALVLAYAFLFRHFMWTIEGREYSFVAGLYWTITAMTTLGFGDITFTTDGGHVFSMVVTLSGVLFMLIILPFGAISLFIGPWMEERLRYRPPLELPEGTAGHVLLCGWDPVTRNVVEHLRSAGIPYALIESNYDAAARLEEEGYRVIYGIPTDRAVLERAGVDNARAVVANLSDTDNANLVLTVRAIAETPVLVIVTEGERVDLMKAAGAQEAIALREVMGGYMAVRSTTRGGTSHIVDSLGDLLFAEIPAHSTPFVGLTVGETAVRERIGASLIGIWERGHFSLPRPETRISAGDILMLAATESSLEALERLTGEAAGEDLVIVLGYGTVGKAAARYLERNEVPHVVVDTEFSHTAMAELCQIPERERVEDSPSDAAASRRTIRGDASRSSVLEEAGICEARGVIVTTNDDGTNLFLTLACRQLNPRIRIVARANREENVEEIYAAGADFVVSIASVGGSILANAIEGRRTIFFTEGIHIFWRPVPRALAGTTLRLAGIRASTGATVIAVQTGDDHPEVDISPETVLRGDQVLLMVGDPASEAAFSQRFPIA